MRLCKFCGRPLSRQRSITRPEGYCYESGGVSCLRVANAALTERVEAWERSYADAQEDRIRAECKLTARVQELEAELANERKVVDEIADRCTRLAAECLDAEDALRELLDVALYRPGHRFDGQCPTEQQPRWRDPECEACRRIAEAERLLRDKENP